MKLTRKRPAGQETKSEKQGIPYHSHIDWSCELDKEIIPYGASHFEGQLLEDMRVFDQPLLEKKYPELIFGWHAGKKEPKERDYRVMVGNRGFRWASWRSK